jgi:hypothetical protein
VSRFKDFTQEERDCLYDALLSEADLNPAEDPSFPRRVEVAKGLMAEVAAAGE